MQDLILDQQQDTGNPSLQNTVLKWGIVAGVVNTIGSILLHYISPDELELPWWSWCVSIGIVLVLMVVAGITYRNQAGGYITYGKAVGVTWFTAVTGIAICAVLMYLFYSYFFDYDAFVETALYEKYKSKGIDDATIRRALESGRQYRTPLAAALSYVVMALVIDIILALILSLFIKRNKPN